MFKDVFDRGEQMTEDDKEAEDTIIASRLVVEDEGMTGGQTAGGRGRRKSKKPNIFIALEVRKRNVDYIRPS